MLACTDPLTRNNEQVRTRPPEILKWVRPDADIIEVLTSEPTECLSNSVQGEQSQNIILGRAAFRSPYLLGGQAARQGLSCNACHTNGRRNEHFYIEGLSNNPGTADVTNFHFSAVLGDEKFNPKSIPSLVKSAKPKTAETKLAQEKFILRLVEKEFEGAAPSQIVKDALINYVRSLGGKTCLQTQFVGKDVLDFRIKIISQELTALHTLSPEDTQTVGFLRLAIRAELGRLYHRFPVSENVNAKLVQLSGMLKPKFSVDSGVINAEWREIRTQMVKEYDRSLFSKSFATKWYKN